ncbi:hypothetical protein XIS1_120008 [Xenorhabdus innexi]|uniref:Uncharacterized protein n=1 Tax=Xenorhabdus innexi TaxID=290109 RepID=A0A1N6MRV9_9GAMM|nr:hypothetical protein XIS1_120008 [Xenorhabdus innexi]
MTVSFLEIKRLFIFDLTPKPPENTKEKTVGSEINYDRRKIVVYQPVPNR